MSGRNREPLAVILGKNKSKHLTKAVIEDRQKQEEAIRGHTDNIAPPKYLTASQKKEFEVLAEELIRLKIFSNLDVDSLARYIDSKTEYVKIMKDLRKMKPTMMVTDDEENVHIVANEAYSKLTRSKNLLFNECRSAAGDLGLTITSRLKLVIPEPVEKVDKTEAERRFRDRL